MMEVTTSGLRAQRFLRGMEAGQLDTLARAATEVIYPAGQRLFADGEFAGKFWLIESGQVNLDLLVPGEGPVVVDHIGIGAIVGWSWLLPPYRWAFGAVCVTEVKAYQFDATAVRELCAADPALRAGLTARLFEVVARRLQDTRTRLIARSGAAQGA